MVVTGEIPGGGVRKPATLVKVGDHCFAGQRIRIIHRPGFGVRYFFRMRPGINLASGNSGKFFRNGQIGFQHGKFIIETLQLFFLHLAGKMKTFQQLLRYHPESAAGYNNLSETLIKLKRFSEAKQAILTAVKLSPDNTGILLNAANLYAMLREDTEAIKFLQLALAKGADAASILNYRELMMLQERPEFKKFYKQMNNQPPSEL